MRECVECGKVSKIFSKGRCRYCASKTYKKASSSKKPKENKVDIDNYFVEKLVQINKTRMSEESGRVISYPTRANICHLFCKRNHPSVAFHLENYVFLTVDEHSELDNKCLDVNNFAELKKRFPRSFDKIMERMGIVRQYVTEKTKFTEAFDKWTDENLT